MEKAVSSISLDSVREEWRRLKGEGVEQEQIRALLERSLRLHAIMQLGHSPIGKGQLSTAMEQQQQHTEVVGQFSLFVISLAKEELCNKNTTVQVLQDIFDVSVVKRCEQLFSIVEQNIDVWKEPFFFDACKNPILRMCNDLLKRLSRTMDTAFCGRILILLAKSLPLNEKSGLNLAGQFNTANVTIYEREREVRAEEDGTEVKAEPSSASTSNAERKEDEVASTEAKEDVDMEVGEIREQSPEPSSTSTAFTPDSQLYSRFWEIQTHFSNPASIAQDAKNHQRFETNLNEVLRVFTTYKLERPSKAEAETFKLEQRRGIEELPMNGTLHNGIESKSMNGGLGSRQSVAEEKSSHSAGSEEDTFFAKYLTNQKLFHLQLADSQFRRYFLFQCLIVVNYLIHNKPQAPNVVRLKDTTTPAQLQETSLKDLSDKCIALLKETYPHGGHFTESIRKVLGREKMWANWKGEGCPDLVTMAAQLEVMMFKKKPQLRHDPHTINLGNKEITRLWSINPDNFDACRDQNRNTVPELVKFLEDGLDQMDPEQEVEEQYKLVNEERYQWMASRFLLMGTDQYMNSVVTDVKAPRMSAAKYLERVILTTALNTPDLQERAQKISVTLKEMEAAAKAAEIEKEAAAKAEREAAARVAEKEAIAAMASERELQEAVVRPAEKETTSKASEKEKDRQEAATRAERDVEKGREADKERGREKEKERERDKEASDNGRERDSVDKGRERDKDKDKEKEKDREPTDKEKDRGREKESRRSRPHSSESLKRKVESNGGGGGSGSSGSSKEKRMRTKT